MEVDPRAEARRALIEHLSADVALRFAHEPLGIAAWRRAFEAYDEDHDGVLGAADFARWLTDTGMRAPERARLLELARLPARLVIADFFAELEVRLCVRRAPVPLGSVIRCEA